MSLRRGGPAVPRFGRHPSFGRRYRGLARTDLGVSSRSGNIRKNDSTERPLPSKSSRSWFGRPWRSESTRVSLRPAARKASRTGQGMGTSRAVSLSWRMKLLGSMALEHVPSGPKNGAHERSGCGPVPQKGMGGGNGLIGRLGPPTSSRAGRTIRRREWRSRSGCLCRSDYRSGRARFQAVNGVKHTRDIWGLLVFSYWR